MFARVPGVGSAMPRLAARRRPARSVVRTRPSALRRPARSVVNRRRRARIVDPADNELDEFEDGTTCSNCLCELDPEMHGGQWMICHAPDCVKVTCLQCILAGLVRDGVISCSHCNFRFVAGV